MRNETDLPGVKLLLTLRSSVPELVTSAAFVGPVHRPHTARSGGTRNHRRQPVPDPGIGEDPGTVERHREPARPAHAVRSCAVRGSQERGFGYVHQLWPDRFPSYRFCSMQCLDAGAALARRRNGMIDKTNSR